MNPEILYEDEYILAIDKPSGLVVHSGVGTKETLVDWILEKYPKIIDVGEPGYDENGNKIERPGIVHRLDKETSGVLVLAKTQESFLSLKKHFKKGKIRKEYSAFVYGKPKKQRGTVNLPIGRSKSDFRKRTFLSASRGEKREARTEYAVISQCKDNTSFMSFFPYTGRTHQIRVHAQSLQTPIVGDKLYAIKRPPLLGFRRLALHARRLTLHIHKSTKLVHITAPYPEDFESALRYCKTCTTTPTH